MRNILFTLFTLTSLALMSQQSEMTSVTHMKYLFYLPDMEAPEAGYPMILFLHGSGERGDNLDLVKTHGPPSFLDDTTDFPFIVVSPQCPEGKKWDIYKLLELIDEIETVAFIDTNRTIVTGLSSGGSATWDLAMLAPGKFAAIVPICGKGDPSEACYIKDVPTWVFHGARDEITPSSYSDEMVKALRACGLQVKYTLYPDVDHFAWVPAYSNPALYDWMLQQKRK